MMLAISGMPNSRGRDNAWHTELHLSPNLAHRRVCTARTDRRPPSLVPPRTLTRMVCAEGILLVLFVIGSCATPQMSVLPPFGGAGIEGPTVVGEREDTGLPV